MGNVILDLLKKLSGRIDPPLIKAADIKPEYTEKDIDLLTKAGISIGTLQTLLQQQTLVNYERFSLAREMSGMLNCPYSSNALDAFANTVATPSPNNGRVVWVTSHDKKYDVELNTLLEQLTIEERMYDWSSTTALYGDLFVKIYGEPGIGIKAIDDNLHPTMIGRIDNAGKLIGFYQTPQALATADSLSALVGKTFETQLLAPWEFVHLRILGATRRSFGKAGTAHNVLSPQYALGNPTVEGMQQFQSKYGTSVLYDAITPYKRYRMAMDCVTLSRLANTPIKRIWKAVIPENAGNPQMVSQLVESYKQILTRASQFDISSANPNYKSRKDSMSTLEELLIPIYGSKENLTYEEVGGKADVKWIVDVEELRDQYITALKVPKALLAGSTAEGTPGGMNTNSYQRIDIRFARQTRRLQQALINGITRLCQIHLAYRGMDPNPEMFEVRMNETSSAEELEQQDAMDKGADTVGKVMDMMINGLGESNVDRVGILDYLNKKILKLEDFEIKKYLINLPTVRTESTVEVEFPTKKVEVPEVPGVTTVPTVGTGGPENPNEPLVASRNRGSDTLAPLPKDLRQATLNEAAKKTNEQWEQAYAGKKLTISIEKTEDTDE